MTLAHPAAVLPFARTRLPLPALVAGSMLPDIPVFLGMPHLYEVSHSIRGVLGIDMVATCLAVVLWIGVWREAVLDMAPGAVRRRFAPPRRPALDWWLLVPVAAWVGAGTHVLWDAFTHGGRWGPRHLAWLDDRWHGYLAYRWLQYGSSVVGLAIVVGALVTAVARRSPRGDTRARRLPPATLPAIAVIGLTAGLAGAIRSAHRGLHDMAFNGVVDSIMTTTALVALACLLWQASRLLSPARTRPGRTR
ncbi:DUF4184 family protein [Nocardioides jiangxiensis]|uniref:DUF4184 family protein n=1 Tax=Nocardioides jiangxiensis TaxID=3064524 RepID=A0ABT9AWQ1_9ACTN|nr:DUF4184 family protein [Nocardioides sp. WY-20]MDO7866901.1 DUF4184 family protein [Nocardioides sp. WY-20]